MNENKTPKTPLRKNNPLHEPCPGCGSHRVWCYVDHEASCLDCSSTLADFSKAAEADKFNFVRHPFQGWLPGKQVSEGVAGRPADPSADPFAQALRRGIETRRSAAGEGESRKLDQLTTVAERQSARRDADDEQREFASRRRVTAISKAQQLAKAQFQVE